MLILLIAFAYLSHATLETIKMFLIEGLPLEIWKLLLHLGLLITSWALFVLHLLVSLFAPVH